MPEPTPQEGEEKQEFISRCIEQLEEIGEHSEEAESEKQLTR